MYQLPPLILIASNIILVVTGLLVFQRIGLTQWNWLWSLVVLAGIYSALNIYRQATGNSQYRMKLPGNWPLLLRRVLARYVVWLGLIYSGYLFYHLEPYYATESFAANQWLFEKLLHYYLFLGIPYFLVTLIFRHSPREDYYDPAIRLIHIVKQITLQLAQGASVKRSFRVMHKRYNRKILLILIMRVYFIPLLVAQVYYNLYYGIHWYTQYQSSHDMMNLLLAVTSCIWLLDVTNASLAYLVESRWLENRSRSIDLTVSGWLVCLMCYAPLNFITGAVLPFAPSVVTYQAQDLLVNDMTWVYVTKTLEALLLFIHVCCGLSLGTSVTNITLRKLQTRGPYGLVRHPGVSTKLLFWLMQSVFYRQFWQAKFIVGYIAWGWIYIGRAFTEERHLKHFPEYREYMRKVKYRFLPWIF